MSMPDEFTRSGWVMKVVHMSSESEVAGLPWGRNHIHNLSNSSMFLSE